MIPNYAEAIGKGGKTVDPLKKDKDVKTLVSTAENTITTDRSCSMNYCDYYICRCNC